MYCGVSDRGEYQCLNTFLGITYVISIQYQPNKSIRNSRISRHTPLESIRINRSVNPIPFTDTSRTAHPWQTCQLGHNLQQTAGETHRYNQSINQPTSPSLARKPSGWTMKGGESFPALDLLDLKLSSIFWRIDYIVLKYCRFDSVMVVRGGCWITVDNVGTHQSSFTPLYMNTSLIAVWNYSLFLL